MMMKNCIGSSGDDSYMDSLLHSSKLKTLPSNLYSFTMSPSLESFGAS